MKNVKLKLLFAVLVIFMTMTCAAQGRTTNINSVKVNQSMSDFHNTAKYRFTERDYGEYLTSFAGYESAFVIVESRADWVDAIGITWNYTDERTQGTMFLNLHDYLVNLYGEPNMKSDFDEDGKHYVIRETFPITPDKVLVSLSIGETANGSSLLLIKYNVMRRDL